MQKLSYTYDLAGNVQMLTDAVNASQTQTFGYDWFDRFYRADRSRARQTGRYGLGLAIVRQLVLAHGGTIMVDNEPGRGSTFRFTVPVAAS